MNALYSGSGEAAPVRPGSNPLISKHIIRTTAAILLILGSATSQAGLLNDNINVTGTDLIDGDFVPTSAIIGDGPEFTFLDDFLFDFNDNSLTITNTLAQYAGWGDFGYATFSGFDELITGFSLSDPTDLSSIGAQGSDGTDRDILSSYSFTSDSVTLHLGTTVFAPNVSITFDISSTVPEPATVALVGLGLAAIRISSRNKRQGS